MAVGCRRTPFPTVPGPHDVGHVQLMRRVFEVQRDQGARFGLREALNGERVLVLGLEPEDLLRRMEPPSQTAQRS